MLKQIRSWFSLDSTPDAVPFDPEHLHALAANSLEAEIKGMLDWAQEVSEKTARRGGSSYTMTLDSGTLRDALVVHLRQHGFVVEIHGLSVTWSWK